MKHSDLKYIDRIGVELEGGWNSNINRKIYADGSVRVVAPYRGEVASPPSTLEEIAKYIKNNTPDVVDDSCGLHIHMSFKNNSSSFLTLMEKDFYIFFKNQMREWGILQNLKPTHQFWHRLAGENRFCKDAFQPEKQVHMKGKGDHRYTQLNYCYAMHGTIECRLFPGFTDPDIIISAVHALVKCYEDYLESKKNEMNDEFHDAVIEDDLIEV